MHNVALNISLRHATLVTAVTTPHEQHVERTRWIAKSVVLVCLLSDSFTVLFSVIDIPAQPSFISYGFPEGVWDGSYTVRTCPHHNPLPQS